MTKKSKCYGIQVRFEKLENTIVIYNGNSFEINDLDVQISEDAVKRFYHINTIGSFSEWKENQHGNIVEIKRKEFNSFGYFEGKPHVINTELFDENTGVYEGEPHHALVWPDTDSDENWRKQLTFQVKENAVEVNISFIARGPKMAFCGHSFTGLWDSSYYYFRELAKMGGWNARLSYSYWGGTGIAHYAGLVEGCKERAEQCEKLINGNEYYDFFIVAGNSNEAVDTYSGKVGATDYRQRPRMLQGAKILHDKIKRKAGRMFLWAPHAYQYGYFQGMTPKPWKQGDVGDIYSRDGQDFLLTMTTEMMADANVKWYQQMAKELGNDTDVLPVCLAYAKLREKYGLSINPYLSPEKGGDYGHQNNIGNYIAACLIYSYVFNESPEGLGVPISHTFGMPGGKISDEQAQIIQQICWKVYNI